MHPRIPEELALLRQFFPSIEHTEVADGDWFLIPDYQVPEGWQRGTVGCERVPLCFKVTTSYLTGCPYAFLLPSDVNFNGAVPQNASPSAESPFAGSWLQFSWTAENWEPKADVTKGSNLLDWARGFHVRLKEGA